jgi:hypothetical protein
VSPARETDFAESPLPRGVLRRLGTRRDRFSHRGHMMAYAKDGRILVAEDVRDEQLLIRDVTRGGEPLRIDAQRGIFTPAATGFVTEPTRGLQLWSLATRAPVAKTDATGLHISTLRGGEEIVFTRSPDVFAWTPATGEVRRIVEVVGTVGQVAGSPASDVVAVGTYDARSWSIVVVDAKGTRTVGDAGSRGGEMRMAFDARGELLVWRQGERLGAVDLTDASSEPKVTPVGACSPCQLAVDASGRYVATTTARDAVVVLDRKTDERYDLATRELVNDLELSPDGKELAVMRGGRIDRFEAATGVQVATADGHDMTGVAALSPSGRRAVTAGWRLHLWDVTTGRIVAEADVPRNVEAAAFVGEDVVVTRLNGGAVMRWSVPDLAHRFLGPPPPVSEAQRRYNTLPGLLASASRAPLYASAFGMGGLAEVRGATGSVVATVAGEINAVALDPAGTVIAFVDADSVVAREVASGRELARVRGEGFGYAGARTSVVEGGALVASCLAGNLHLVHPDSPDFLVLKEPLPCSAVAALDADTVLFGDAQGNLSRLQLGTGEVTTVQHQEGAIVSISATPAGVLVGSDDGTALLYPPRPDLMR